MQWIVDIAITLQCAIETFIWDSTKLNRKYYKAQGNKFFSAKQDVRKLKYLAIMLKHSVQRQSRSTLITFTKKFGKRLMIVWDESTKGKNPKALRTKAILQYNNVGDRMILTGTPAAKDPMVCTQYEFLGQITLVSSTLCFKHKYGLLVNDRNFHTGRSFQRGRLQRRTSIFVKSN